MPTLSATKTPTKADYEITINLVGSNAVPDPIPPMTVGQTVLYKSLSGQVRIEFPTFSPFRTDDVQMTSVPGGQILKLVSGSRGGTLECRCFIQPEGASEVGWSLENPTSGGRHKVTPP